MLHPVVLGALVLWIVNDHVLKGAFPGLLTGKLSDAAGLIAFPAVLAASIPERLTRTTSLARITAIAAFATALVFAWINVDPGFARLVTPAFAALPRLVRVLGGADASSLRSPVRHVTDLEDLLVLPFALVAPCLTMPAAVRRSLVRAGARAVGAAMVVACGLGGVCRAQATEFATEPRPAADVPQEPTPARRSSLALAVDGLLGGTRFEEIADRGEFGYLLTGARVALAGRHGRFRYGGSIAFVSGSLTRVPPSYEEFGVVHPTYRGVVATGRVGFERRVARLDATLLYAAAHYAGGGGRNGYMSGAFRITLGRRARVAYTMQLGSNDAFLADSRLFDQGVLLERKRFTIRLAAGVGMLVTPDIAADSQTDRGIRASVTEGPNGIIFPLPDAFVDLETHVVLTPRVALDIWVQGGMQWPRGRLGIAVALGRSGRGSRDPR